jgi:hypothetical protein
MVAAWIWAETGVGPAMASGSQTDNGNWADFPAAPVSNNRPRVVTTAAGMSVPMAFKWTMETEPESWYIQTMAIPKAMSPMRVVMNALRPAVAFCSSVYQKPIRA